MRRFLEALLTTLTPEDRRFFVLLLVLAFITALLQVISVAAIMPFVTVLIEPAMIETTPLFSEIYHYLGFTNLNQFVVLAGLAVLALLVLSNGFMAFDLWLSLRFGFHLEHKLACRLLGHYLRLPYESFRHRDQAVLSKNILTEVQRAAVGTVLNAVSVFSDLMMAIFLGLLLLLVDPWISVSTLVVLGIAYTAIYAVLQGRIDRLGAEFPRLHAELLRKTQEALASFREIKVVGGENHFVSRFATPSRVAADNSVRYRLLELLPVLLLETIAFATLLSIAIIIALRSEGVSDFIGVVALYGLAAYRLVPAIKEVFSGAATIKYNLAAFDLLREDLMQTGTGDLLSTRCHGRQATGVPATGMPATGMPATGVPAMAKQAAGTSDFASITLQGVWFRYGDEARYALQDVNFTLRRGQRLCVVGPSGSGKSTLIDLLLGLLAPARGCLLLNGEVLVGAADTGRDAPSAETARTRLRHWQRSVGYVPQATLLLEESVAANIAFGIDAGQIDMQKVERAARQAQIHDFIVSGLSAGYHTVIAREGLKLSGGQQQRIGIARALYHDPAVLILDEASSALDLQTETRLLECLLALADKTLVFVSHKANVAAHCDQVLVIDEGRIRDLTTYQALLEVDNPYRHLLENDPAASQGEAR